MLRQATKFFTTIQNHFATTIENPFTKGFISYAWEQDADKFGLICLNVMEQTPTIEALPKSEFKASYIRVQVNNKEKLYYSYYQTADEQVLVDITPAKAEKLKELDDVLNKIGVSPGTVRQLDSKELQSINEKIGHGQMEKNKELQDWIRRLQEDLEASVLQEVFLDTKKMHGNLKHTMRINLEQSDIVFFICNPRFNERFSEGNNCGLLVMTQEPTMDNLTPLNLPYTNLYVLADIGAGQRLYYKNNWGLQRIELGADKLRELETILALKSPLAHKLLSLQELQQITAITYHAHNNLIYEVLTVLHEKEKRPDLKVMVLLQKDAQSTDIPSALNYFPMVDLTGPYSVKKFTGFHEPGLLGSIYDLKEDEYYKRLLYGFYLSKIPKAAKLFGRDKELEDLKQSVAQESLSYLIGDEDTGLSALAVNFAKQARADSNRQGSGYPLVRYFQIDSQNNWVELIKAFAEELEVDSSNWWQALSDLPTKWLIVLDSGRVKIGWEPSFKSTAYQQRLLKVQSTSIETPTRVINVSPLSIEARLQIIRHYLGDNPLDDEKKLIVQYRCSLTELMATINYVKSSPWLDINRFLKYNLKVSDFCPQLSYKPAITKEVLEDESTVETTEQLITGTAKWPLLKAGVKKIVEQRRLTVGLLHAEKEVIEADKLKNDIQDCGINVIMLQQAPFPKIDALIIALTPNFKVNFSDKLREAIAGVEEGKVYPLVMNGDFSSSVPSALYAYLVANQKDGYEKVLLGLEPLGIISAICNFHVEQRDYKHYWHHYSYSNLPSFDTKLMGRSDIITQIKNLLISEDICKKEKLVAITGMGGFGKSSLAIMYGHKYKEDYDLIRVIKSEGQALGQSLLTFASDLGLEIKGKKITEVMPDLHTKLAGFARYLLIFDNATTFDEIREYLAPITQPGQHILVTSRDSTSWSHKIELSVFSEAEANEYLTKELGEESLELATAMGFLPLALSTTAAFIKQKRHEGTYSIKDYLTDHKAGSIKGADNPVKRSLVLALPKIAQVSEDALHLLRFCAFMSPDEIASEWLGHEKLLGNIPRVYAALNVVASFSMITVNNYKLSMHRLMSEAIRESIELTPEEILKQYLLPLKELLVSIYPWEKPKMQDYALAQQLTTHIAQLESYMAGLSNGVQISESTQNEVTFARGLLLSMCADAFGEAGEFKKQRDLLEQALPLINGKGGDENTELEYAITLNELASAYGNLDNHVQQRNLLEQALPILQKHYGSEHIEVGKLLVNLANAYGGLNNYAKEQELLEQALPIMEHAYGKTHVNYAITLANFAQVYGKIGNYTKQQELLKQALAIKKEQYGDKHLSYATTLVALANALGDVKNYTEQLELLQIAQGIYQETYGDKHQRTTEVAQQILETQQKSSQTLIKAVDAAALTDKPLRKTPWPLPIFAVEDKEDLQSLINTEKFDLELVREIQHLRDSRQREMQEENFSEYEGIIKQTFKFLQSYKSDKDKTGTTDYSSDSIVENKKQSQQTLEVSSTSSDSDKEDTQSQSSKTSTEHSDDSYVLSKESLVELLDEILNRLERISANFKKRSILIKPELIEHLNELSYIIAEKGIVGFIPRIVALGGNLDYISDVGLTPLHIAIIHDNYDYIQDALLAGADLTITTTKGFSLEGFEVPTGADALEIAKLKGNKDIIKMIEDFSTIVAEDDLENQIVKLRETFAIIDLASAIRVRHLKAARYYLQRGESANDEIEEVPFLIYAVQKKDVALCKLLLDFNADKEAEDEYGNSAFYLAARAGSIELCELFLSLNCDVNYENNHDSLLHAAVSSGNLELVKKLIERGVTLDVQDGEGDSALEWAYEADNLAMFELLLEAGINPDIQNERSEALIHLAVRSNKPWLVLLLLNAGANVDLCNKARRLPKEIAARLDDEDNIILKLLMPEGYEQLLEEQEKEEKYDQVVAHLKRVNYDGQLNQWAEAADLASLDEFFDKVFSQLQETLTSAGYRKKAPLDFPDRTRRTALHWLIRHRAEEMVARFIDAGADINWQDEKGWSPLHIAAMRGNLEIARNLLLNGADYKLLTTESHNEEDDELIYPARSSARDIAVLEDYPAIIELIDTHNAHIDSSLEQRRTALMQITDVLTEAPFKATDLTSAVRCGDLITAAAYLAAGADPDGKVDDEHYIVYAAKNVDFSMCKLLYKFRANMSIGKAYNDGLCWAIKSGLYSMFKLFIANYPKEEIITPPKAQAFLYAAIASKNADIFTKLLDIGVNPNLQDEEGKTALHYIVINIDEPTYTVQTIFLERLFAKRIDLNIQDKEGNTALHYAAKKAQSSITKLLIKNGAKLTILNKDKLTPLMLAQKHNAGIVMKLLLQSQVTPIQQEHLLLPGTDELNPGKSLLEAAIRNDLAAVDAILQLGLLAADNQDKQKRTALHWAVLHHNLEMVKKLIEFKANVDAQDTYGLTPFYLAIYHAQKEILDLFIAADANIFLLLDECYQEEGRPLCWVLTRGLALAKQIQDEGLCKKLQDYAYKQKMTSSKNHLIAAMASYNFELVRKYLKIGDTLEVYDGDWPVLFYAVESNDIELLKLLQAHKADILVETKEGKRNMLDIAVRYSTDKRMLEYVLSLGFNVNRQNPVNLATPLIGACYFRSLEFVKILYDKGADVTLTNKFGTNPFIAVCESEHLLEPMRVQTAKYLMEQTIVDIEAKDNQGKNSIYWAATRGSREVFDILMARKVPHKIKSDDGWTPLMCACVIDDEVIAEKLIADGADIEAKNDNDWTVLGIAASNQSVRCVQLLLDKSVDCNRLFAKGQWSPMQLAARKGDIAIIKLLLNAPLIDIDVRNKIIDNLSGDRTAVIEAACNGYYEVVKLLVEEGAVLNQYDRKGWTALKVAVANQYIQTVKVLLSSPKINPNYRMNDTRYMNSALNIACRDGNVEIVKLLLADPRIDVNQDGFFYGTALTQAADNNHIEVVKLLLARDDIDLNGVDTDGNTALMIAQQKKHKEIEQLILEKMKTQGISNPLHHAVETEDMKQIDRLLKDGTFDINVLNRAKETALYVATKLGKTQVVRRLLQHPKIEGNIPNVRDMTPLYTAATYGFREIVRLLIQAGVDVNKMGPMFVTPLSQAAELGRTDITAELLMSPDLNPNLSRPVIGNDGGGPMTYASSLSCDFRGLSDKYRYFSGNRIAVQALLLKHPKINVNIHNGMWCGYSFPLLLAIPNVEFMRQLLQHPKIKINECTRRGHTVFSQVAFKLNRTANIYIFLNRPGLNVNATDKEGCTVLYLATDQNNYHFVKVLLQIKGIMLNKSNHKGQTSLWIASKLSGRLNLVKLLLAHPEIDIIKANRLGETPLHIAVSSNNEDIVRAIVEHALDNDKDCGLFTGDNSGLTPRLRAIKDGNLKISSYLKEAEDEVLQEQEQAQQKKLARKTLRQIKLTEQFQKAEKISEKDILEINKDKQVDFETDQYLVKNQLLKAFTYQLQSKLIEIFLIYRNAYTDKITLLDDTISIPALALVADALKYVDDKSEKNDEPTLSSTEKLIIGICSNMTLVNTSVQKITRVLALQYQEQIINLKDERQAEVLAECAMLRILAMIEDDVLVANFPIWQQIGFIISLARTQEAYKKLKDRPIVIKGDNDEVWSDKGIFEQTGIRLIDGRCFAKPDGYNKYGYRLGVEEDVQALGLVAVELTTSSEHIQGCEQYNYVSRSAEIIRILTSLILKEDSLQDILASYPISAIRGQSSLIMERKQSASGSALEVTDLPSISVKRPLVRQYSAGSAGIIHNHSFSAEVVTTHGNKI